MMNFLFESLPRVVNVNGADVPIITDFREWIKFYDMLHDKKLSDSEKFFFLLSYYKQDPGVRSVPEFMSPLIDFFTMRNALKSDDTDLSDTDEALNDGSSSDRSAKKSLYDFKIDSRFIISGFLQDYNIDLLNVEYLHWWHFRILLDGLSSRTEFKQRIMYRNANPAEIKDKKERARIIRIQRAIALPKPPPSDFETGDLFW